MSDCKCLAGCPFFNDKMPGDAGIGAIYKKKYCLGDNSKCARFLVFSKLGKEAVPKDLFPNMYEKAQAIVSQAGK